jgi:hypothetical protein
MPTCYMCSKEGVTVEHVPPRCLFPEQKDLPQGVDLRKELITVPSCDEHNSKKSKDDEYILYCLAVNLPANSVAEDHFLTKIIRAIDRNPSIINRIVENHAPVRVNDTETGEWFDTVAVPIDTDRLYSDLECMARALYFYHYKKQWRETVQIEPEFLLAMGTPNDSLVNDRTEKVAKSSDILFKEVQHYGKNPEVFTYQTVEGNAKLPFVMRLHFYGRCRVTVAFRNSG